MRLKLRVHGAAVQLQEREDGLYWVEALRCGSWDYPGMEGGGFEIDQAKLDEFVANFEAGEKGRDVLLNVDHDDDAPAGWVKRLVRRGEGDDPETGARLWAGFEIADPEIRRKVDLGLLKYSSSELDFSWVNPERCRTDGDCEPRSVFEGLALTNRPYVKGLRPIVLAEPFEPISPATPGCKCGERRETKRKEGHMKTVEELEAELAEARAKLAENDSAAELKAKLTEAEKQRKDTDRRLRELETSTRLNEVGERIKKLVRGRRVTPAVGNRLTRLATALVRGGAATVTLSEKVKVRLAEGDGEEELDKLDVVGEVLDMLQELPDALSSKVEDADLSEEDDEDEGKESDDDKVKAAEAAAIARVKTEKRPFRVLFTEELAKRGVQSALGGGAKR